MRLCGFENSSLIRIALFLLFPGSIIVDLINGYCQVQLGIITPIGQLYRLLIMGILIYLISTHPHSIVKINSVLFFFIISFPLWLIMAGFNTFSGFNLSIELEGMIKIIYFFIVILFFISNKEYINTKYGYKLISRYGLYVSIAIILSFVTGYGNYSINADYGFGTKSFFKAGNDLGLTVLYSLVVSSFCLVKYFTIKNIIYTLTIALGGIFIGTRVGILGTAIWVITLLSYLCFLYNPGLPSMRRRLVLFKLIVAPLLIGGIYFVVIFLCSVFDQYMINKFAIESMVNARGSLTEYAEAYIADFNIYDLMFGKGISSLYYYVGKYELSLGEYRMVEADIHEIIGGYGIVGLIIIMTPFVYFFVKALKNNWYHPSFYKYGNVFITGTFLIISFVAGHCLKNTMVAPIYGFIASVIYYEKKNIISK